jgi:hypothetical protein
MNLREGWHRVWMSSRERYRALNASRRIINGRALTF